MRIACAPHLLQPDIHGDIITAVTCFANNHNLIPAFDGAVTTQLGLSIDVPPSYDQAERVLQVNAHAYTCVHVPYFGLHACISIMHAINYPKVYTVTDHVTCIVFSPI